MDLQRPKNLAFNSIQFEVFLLAKGGLARDRRFLLGG